MVGGYLLAKSALPVIVEDEPAVIIDVCNNERRSAVLPPAEDAAPDNKDIDMATATEQVGRPSADEDEQTTSAATMTHLVVTKCDLPAKSSKKMASEYFRRINIARRRRETQRSRSSVCCGLLLLVFLLACSVVLALILAGVLKLGSSGHRDLTMAAGGLPSSSSTTNNPGQFSSSENNYY